MFRQMRRCRQTLDEEACVEILKNQTSGVLALSGDEGYPYAVPLSYVYTGSGIYFHAAVSGHKIDAVKRCEKASFCVIGQDLVVPEKYTTYYKSVIVFGKIRILEDAQEIRSAAELLAEKYNPAGTKKEHEGEITMQRNRLCMLELVIEHMTGKAAKEII